MKHLLILTVLIAIIIATSKHSAHSQEPLKDATIINDEGGTVAITGEVTYTNPFFTSGISQPLIILEDQAGFIERDLGFLFPPESQTLGQITSDFYDSPFSYSIALPIEPQGTLKDVDNDDVKDTGVMVFAVAYWANVWGDPFLEERDQQGGGWSTAYASTRISTDPNRLREVIGGKYLIYAPDDQQGFPEDFGEDELLFTTDDPIVRIPQGFTIVDMDTVPFTFDRSQHPKVDLIEPPSAAITDFSELSYTDAFDAMINKLSREYAFTEYNNIDWDSIETKYRSFFEEAESTGDTALYLDTLSELIWSIPDGHVNVSPLNRFDNAFRDTISRGIGLSISETDDGNIYAVFVVEDSPAANSGISVGDKIIAINGQDIQSYVKNTRTWSTTTSTEHNKRLAKLRYATRFPPVIEEVSVTYINNMGETITQSMETVSETDSFFYTPYQSEITGLELPIEYRIIDDSYILVSIYSFFDNQALMIQIWERMIEELNQNNLQGLIIDMRVNGGGSGFLADQMAAYFFQEPLTVGKRGYYSEEIDAFFFDPELDQQMYLPVEELRYDGSIVVLVGPDCASACERFSYDMSLQNRAVIMGHYPTAGLGGSVEDFLMPEDITIRFTAGRSVDVNGNIHIEGIGVQPTIDVPLTEEALLGDQDVLLQEAINYLNAETAIEFVQGGTIRIGETVEGQLDTYTKVYYVLDVSESTSITISLNGNQTELDTILALYHIDGPLIDINDNVDDTTVNAAIKNVSVDAGEVYIIEVSGASSLISGSYVLEIEEANE